MTKRNTYPEADKNEERPLGAKPIENYEPAVDDVHYTKQNIYKVLCGFSKTVISCTNIKSDVTCPKCLSLLKHEYVKVDEEQPINSHLIREQNMIIGYLEQRIFNLETELHKL